MGWGSSALAAQIRGAVTPNLSKQIKYKLHMAAGSWWRVAVAVLWFGAQRVCGSCRGAWLLELFVSPRIGEVMPLGSVR